MKKIIPLLIAVTSFTGLKSASILIPMDQTQTDHLKAYGIAWHVLDHNMDVKWLLNYRGGSFIFEYSKEDEQRCLERNVKFETLPDVMAKSIIGEVSAGAGNTAAIDMQRSPKIAVYAPPYAELWDDAVSMVLKYAEIPFDILYDPEILRDDLKNYDWLHLHHEDFTGQQGRYFLYSRTKSDRKDWMTDSTIAAQFRFAKNAHLKLAVAKRIKTFVASGGFLFAMCSATETFDIAFAAEGVDITSAIYDNDPYDPDFQSKLRFDNCLAFENFKLNVYGYVHSDINTYMVRNSRGVTEKNDQFALSNYSALTHPVQSMLVQNHTTYIKGFWGATTAFDLQRIKKDVDILAAMSFANEARYIHGEFGEGLWTYYGGHDPEDYQHRIGEEPTDVSKYPNSAGYRLILNNVLFQSTRTAEESHSQFFAYPSPATDLITINYTLVQSPGTNLMIYDLSGKMVYSNALTENSASTQVDVSGFAAGNYVWRLESAGKILHDDKFSVVR